MKKTLGDIIILYKCTKNHDHILYCSWDMAGDRCNCCIHSNPPDLTRRLPILHILSWPLNECNNLLIPAQKWSLSNIYLSFRMLNKKKAVTVGVLNHVKQQTPLSITFMMPMHHTHLFHLPWVCHQVSVHSRMI